MRVRAGRRRAAENDARERRAREACLRLDQDHVDKEHDKVVLDVFVGKALAARTLCQTDAPAERTVVGAAVGGVERADGEGALDADEWRRWVGRRRHVSGRRYRVSGRRYRVSERRQVGRHSSWRSVVKLRVVEAVARIELTSCSC